jgi:hypothetical protein
VHQFKKYLSSLWTLPNTLVGLLFLIFALKGSIEIVDGALEIEGPGLDRIFRRITNSEGRLLAFTLGQVVIGSNKAILILARDHERRHVRQYERWGVFFIPAFFLASFWAKLQGKHPYRDNRFEREARRERLDKRGEFV